ncbi:hypothetical protein JJE66_33700 [Bradyrhizobium diazoefficiens]|uniref:hypothetical protein n=1 Tax=Bradyrhizobium diazoefficiens TaxID=1355477 RepID=UPI00190DD172|nr:hypothetical protein [Bradyrhizobium diazoefficiens]MBK3666163.1 hypothetical protein [Bradyrhizobium diazoefficiens]
MEFECRGTPQGTLHFNRFEKQKFIEFLKENPGVRLKITPELPESGRLRRYFEGAIVPLIAFYQQGMDHHSSEDRRRIREWLKEEFNGEMIDIGGKIHTVPKSTKGRAVLTPFVERVLDWMNENYAPPSEALDPERFKYWRDTVFPHGGPDNFIDYNVETGILRV